MQGLCKLCRQQEAASEQLSSNRSVLAWHIQHAIGQVYAVI